MKNILNIENNISDSTLIISIITVFVCVFLIGVTVGGIYYHSKYVEPMEQKIYSQSKTIEALESGIKEMSKINAEINKEKYIVLNDLKRMREEISELKTSYTALSQKYDDLNRTQNYDDYLYVLDNFGLNEKDIDDIIYYSMHDNDGVPTVGAHVVLSVLYRESTFRANAVSNTGRAFGMGQLKLNTARYMKDIYNLDDVINETTLLDKSLNIKYTTLFLNYLHRKYDGDHYRILMHYSGSRSRESLDVYLGGVNLFLYRFKGVGFDDIIPE